MDIEDINTYILKHRFDSPVGCFRQNLSLSEPELLLAKTLYWLRNRKLGQTGAQKLSILWGPKGHKLKPRGEWFPHPDEYCGWEDNNIDGRWHPYGLYHHCHTSDHIKFIAKYKTKYILDRANTENLAILMRIMSYPYEDLPLLVNTFDKDTRENVYYKMLVLDRLNKVCQMES